MLSSNCVASRPPFHCCCTVAPRPSYGCCFATQLVHEARGMQRFAVPEPGFGARHRTAGDVLDGRKHGLRATLF
eukprot:15443382-Alexandrium_andersonii.AAC.1